MNLSAHFSLDEFERSVTAAERGIDNSIPADLMDNARDTADMLERIRAALSAAKGHECAIKITSGYRCPDLNRAVRGQPQSDHLKACAADIQCPDFGTPKEVAQFLADRRSELQIGQIIHEFDSWTHVSVLLPANHANCVITIDHEGTRVGVC